jgi:chorismate synthase
MNTVGTIFRVSIFGESHGPSVGVIIDGCPAGLPFWREELMADLSRRKGLLPGTTPRRESDEPEVISGILNNFTTGAPLVTLHPKQAISGPVTMNSSQASRGRAMLTSLPVINIRDSVT